MNPPGSTKELIKNITTFIIVISIFVLLMIGLFSVIFKL